MLKTAQTRLLPQHIGIGEPSLIRPLCAPIMPDDSFGAEVAGRYSERVYSLWKRLSLVYAEEGVQAAAPEKPPVIVNSFTSSVLVQLFAGNHFSRLVKYDQPNSVFLTKFSVAAQAEEKRVAAELARRITERTELTLALEEFGKTLSGAKSERGAFVALAALSRISAGNLTDGGRRALATLSAVLSEADGDAARKAAELSHAADERTVRELSEKLTELTRRYSAAAERNRALSAAVEYAAELIESGSVGNAAPEAVSRAALERFGRRSGIQGAAEERLRALSERAGQGGALSAVTGAARVLQQQARAGLTGAQAETAALAAQMLVRRAAAANPAYSAGALSPYTGAAGVPAERTRAELVFAQEGAQQAPADIAASAARRAVTAAGRSEGAERLLGRASRYIADKLAAEQRAAGRGAGAEGAALANSGADEFYRTFSEYAVSAEQRRRALNLQAAPVVGFVQNGANGAHGSDGARGIDGADGANGTPAAPAMGTILPAEAAHGALLRAGEVVFAQNGADGADGARGNDGANGTNGTPAAPARGTVLPAEAARGALSRTGEVVFAQNGANGANGSDGACGNDGSEGMNGTPAAPARGTALPAEAAHGTLSRAGEVVFAQNGADGMNGSPAAPARGTILPVEAAHGALSRAGEVVFAQNGANGSDGARGIDGANGTNGTPAAPARGTILPAEAAHGALSRAGEVVFAQNGANGSDGAITRNVGRILPAGRTIRATAGSEPSRRSAAESGISRAVMDRLDPQTASALAGLVREAKGTAGQGAVYTAAVVPAEMEHSSQQPLSAQPDGISQLSAAMGAGISTNAMRIMLMNLRTTALSRKNTTIGTENVSRHMRNVIRSAGGAAAKYDDSPYLAMRSAVTFRTAESADMVMLAPPVEMDRFSAESGYSRQMPPIEFRQREEAPAPPPAAKPKAISRTTEQTVRTQLPKGLDDLSYAEISRLADKVYAQIEARLNRERIRRGL